MAYRLKLGEPISKGMRRVALEQVEQARARLESQGGAPAAIHDCRRSIKRVRALLRLVRPGIGETVFKRENVAMRDTARLLSGARDEYVLLETMLKLEAAGVGKARKDLAPVRKALAARKRDHSPGDAAGAVTEAAARLKAAAKRFRRLHLEPQSFEPIGRGLELVYRRGREAMEQSFANPSNEAFHEWRKGVQQHREHMQLLRAAWPAYVTARFEQARALSRLLGEDHDVALLTGFIEALGQGALTTAQKSAALAACAARQRDLRKQARAQGRRLYAEGPEGLRRRLAIYWETAGDIVEVTVDDRASLPAIPVKPAKA